MTCATQEQNKSEIDLAQWFLENLSQELEHLKNKMAMEQDQDLHILCN
jgi:hypothetical protein